MQIWHDEGRKCISHGHRKCLLPQNKSSRQRADRAPFLFDILVVEHVVHDIA